MKNALYNLILFVAFILAVMIATVCFTVLAESASAETVSSTPSTPIYCQPDVIKAMGTIWMMTGNGSTPMEATFILNGTPEAYTIEIEKSHNEAGSQSIYTLPATFAVMHVHPNRAGAYPSTPKNSYTGGQGDTGMADKLGVDVYVVSSRGLTVYYPASKATKMLRQNFDWTSMKGCK